MEVLDGAIKDGKVKNRRRGLHRRLAAGQRAEEHGAVPDRNRNKVDAVVASNDGTAGGVVAALAAQGMAGSVPVSGQDGDHAALNRVALGTQTVSVWKDARQLGRTAGEQAMTLAKGTKLAALQGTKSWADGPRKVAMTSILLTPVPITKDNLDVVIQAGWAPKDVVCRGVKAGTAQGLQLK